MAAQRDNLSKRGDVECHYALFSARSYLSPQECEVLKRNIWIDTKCFDLRFGEQLMRHRERDRPEQITRKRDDWR